MIEITPHTVSTNHQGMGAPTFSIEDDLMELRDSNSVIESYAQLVSRVESQTVTMQQVGSFLFIMYEQQLRILDKIEAQLLRNRKANVLQTMSD